MADLIKRLKKALPSFAVWLFWATVQALVGGLVGILLVSLYLRGR
ncbi:hypothetical protein [Streptomyces sp. NPDC088812]